MSTSHAALINESVALFTVVCSVEKDTWKSLLFLLFLGLWGRAKCLDPQLCFACQEKRFSCAGCLLLRAPPVQQRPGRCAFKQCSLQMHDRINCSPVINWTDQPAYCHLPQGSHGLWWSFRISWWQPSHAGLSLAQVMVSCSQLISLAPCCDLKPSLSHTEVCGEVATL